MYSMRACRSNVIWRAPLLKARVAPSTGIAPKKVNNNKRAGALRWPLSGLLIRSELIEWKIDHLLRREEHVSYQQLHGSGWSSANRLYQALGRRFDEWLRRDAFEPLMYSKIKQFNLDLVIPKVLSSVIELFLLASCELRTN